MNRTEIVAYSVDRGTGYIIYKVSPEFIERYSNWLPTGNIFEWYLKRDVRLWLDSICYYSFVNSSVGGNFPYLCSHLSVIFFFYNRAWN